MIPASTLASMPIETEDIRWVESVLSLPAKAFGDSTSPRCAVLLSKDSADISACPGSGKTTLAVAKIGILSRHWVDVTRGMCVLSHTNAARYEIEARLSRTPAGRKLLTYPHYIGTIHGFVNEFLALPSLRSLGFAVKMIDTNVCSRRRWAALPFGTKKYLDKQNFELTNIRITDAQFNFTKDGGPLPFATTTETYRNIQSACATVARAGYHCYDDMFMWARDLLTSRPEMADVLRNRFPIVVIDEAQDNSEMQSSLLQTLFPWEAVTRYRFGDPNQAIFDFFGGSGATTDAFPKPELKKSIVDSYRFGQVIATLADPLGITPYGLHGVGPRVPLSSGLSSQNTIFLFEEKTIHGVLPRYGELLLQTFSDSELERGVFSAVGQVHNPPASYGSNQFPKYVGDYWGDYDPELATHDSRPSFFVSYVIDAQRQTRESNHSGPGVHKFAEGMIRIVQLSDSGNAIQARRTQHRVVLERLDDDMLLAKYVDVVTTYILELASLTQDAWENKIRPIMVEVAGKLNGAPVTGKAVNEFLQWIVTSESGANSFFSKKPTDNNYHHSVDNREVQIRVGSIHSVKGKTHTATLVLETFWHEHNIASLLPWLSGDKSGGSDVGKRDSLRLRVHYVAMTRPTHLVCLAMHRRAVSVASGELDQGRIGKLQMRGWEVVSV
jgi:DNA helicase-2/ATP-dependent DNA helicase PcrA